MLKTILPKVGKYFSVFAEHLEEFYNAPYRRVLTKAHQEEHDFFMLMVFSESLGIPNPLSFYTLELLPFLLEDFHDWHTRMGVKQSPLDGFRCC